MEIVPIAFDSMGARGMSCLVTTKENSFLIDPGVNLGPRRHKLPPHPTEVEKKAFLWDRIRKTSMDVNVVILTHYHYDHLNPEGYEVFFGKRVFLKNPDENINYNQRKRAHLLLDALGGKTGEVSFADGNQYCFGEMTLEFSPAVPHGMDTKRGYVIQVLFQEGDFRFLFTSDVEGANLDGQFEFIVKHNPSLLLIDGPAITFPKCRTHRVCDILENTDVKTVIVDHHIMREPNWKDYMRESMEIAHAKGVRLISSAKYLGEEENLLEARRVELYEKYPL